MTEDDVVAAVCTHLQSNGYEIVGRLTTKQRGVDVVAIKHVNGQRRELHVEAKGATSARAGSARYGASFNSGQVFDHVAKAFYKAAAAATRETTDSEPMAAMALPDDALHRRHVAPLLKALAELKVGVFWVGARGTSYDGPRGL